MRKNFLPTLIIATVASIVASGCASTRSSAPTVMLDGLGDLRIGEETENAQKNLQAFLREHYGEEGPGNAERKRAVGCIMLQSSLLESQASFLMRVRQFFASVFRTRAA